MKEHHLKLIYLDNKSTLNGVGKHRYYHCSKCGCVFYIMKDIELNNNYMKRRHFDVGPSYAIHRGKAYIVEYNLKLRNRNYCRFSSIELDVFDILK